MTEPVMPSDRANWNAWARLANDVTAALDHLDQRFLFSRRTKVAKHLWELGYRQVLHPGSAWAIVELSLNLSGPPPEGEPHPARTPIGPFASREEAEDWASIRCLEHGGGSWTITEMVKP